MCFLSFCFCFFGSFGEEGEEGKYRQKGLVFFFFLMDGGDNVTLMSELLHSSSGRGGKETLG